MSQPQGPVALAANDDIEASTLAVPAESTTQTQFEIKVEKPLQPVSEASPSTSTGPRAIDSAPSTTGTSIVSPPSTDTTPSADPTSSPSMPSLPAVDHPISSSSQPSLSITLLLISGARYPFTIDAAFLTRHSITALEDDPLNLGVYTLKECIWKDWREAEWDQRPASAHFIRLIHFGRLLDDRQQLRDCRLNPETPNVVHMTVRPAEAGDDDMTQRSTKMAFGRDGAQGEGSSPSCRCVIL